MKKQKVRFHRNDKRPGGLNQNLITSLAYPNILLLTIENIYKNLNYDYNT